MKRLCASIAVVMLVLPAPAVAQARPDFSGTWTFNQGKSTRGTGGNTPIITFPSEMVIRQTPAELHVASSTMRQAAVTAVYKLDGTEVTVGTPEGISEKAKAGWDAGRLVIASRRSFSSPIGDIVTDFKETWTLSGSVLTIEKTRTSDGITDTEKAVFDKNAS